jgi:small GTP-binding protein
MSEQFKYDVFLSHCFKDRAVVRELAVRLRADGLRVWLDEWQIKPGDMIWRKIEEGLEGSRVLVLCISKDIFESEWAAMESGTFRFRDPTNQERRFVPLRLDSAQIKDSLRQFAYVDWQTKSPREYAKLVAACSSAHGQIPATKPVAETERGRAIPLACTASINVVALTVDGHRALSGSDDSTIRLWDVEKRTCIAVLEGHSDSVQSAVVSGDGRHVLSGSRDGTLRLWDLSKRTCSVIAGGAWSLEETGPVLALSMSADGRLALSGSDDGKMRLWNLRKGECVASYEGHTDSVQSVALSADGRLALSGSGDETIRLWDLEGERCITTIRCHAGPIRSVALDDEGRYALCGGADYTLRVWNLRKERCIATLRGHTDLVNSIALRTDGQLALSGSSDHTVRVWDLRRGCCVAILEGHTAGVRSVALSTSGCVALSGGEDNTMRLWDVEEGKQAAMLGDHSARVHAAVLSDDGCRLITGSHDSTLRLWDVEKARCLATLQGHAGPVWSVTFTPDGHHALSASQDGTARLWDLDRATCVATLKGHTDAVRSVVVAPDRRYALTGSADCTVRLWDIETQRCVATLKGHWATVRSVAMSEDACYALSGSDDGTLRLWHLQKHECIARLEGHSAGVSSVALTADRRYALSGSDDKTVRLWNLERYRCVSTLEGHTGSVTSVALDVDGRHALSGSYDKTLRLWDLEENRCIATLRGHTGAVLGIALTPDGRQALSIAINGIARLWTLSQVEKAAPREPGSRYTNAKVLLVGESGVGKTGLMYRLTQNHFRSSISTDAAWATQLKLTDTGEQTRVEREIWLWDFAGQADYRLIHQLYMDETALAVLVFNPQSEDPFEGLGSWDRDLQRAARRPFKKLLVAARCDRGGLIVSRSSIERFREERGFSDYIETSALRGTNCDKLRNAIVREIPWDDIPWTASPRIFRLLKNEIVRLKEEGKVLMRICELKQQLEMRLPGETFTVEELRAVVALLAGPGVVWQLEFGDFVLLQPERINSYAAAVVRSVRAHVEEIGCIAEEDVLAGRLDYQDMKRLPHDEEQIVLRAMHQTLLDHGLCLREHTDRGDLLILPSYFRRERPELKAHPLVLLTYQFNGPLDEIYATLVVRLHHTKAFEGDHLWRFAADFKTPGGKRLGLKMAKRAEGAGELEVYFETGIPDDVHITFIRYVHEHLMLKAHDVVRLRHYICTHCGAPVQNREAIQLRLDNGFKDIVCSACEQRVPLMDLIEEKFRSEESRNRVRELDERVQVAMDNESRELILKGHAYVIAGEAGQIYTQYVNPHHGIDGEIEFRDHRGKASGKRLYLQLGSGDSYAHLHMADDTEVFTIKNSAWAEYWLGQTAPIMLVTRISDGTICWMDVRECLRREGQGGKREVRQFSFRGAPFTAFALLRLKEQLLGPPPMPT